MSGKDCEQLHSEYSNVRFGDARISRRMRKIVSCVGAEPELSLPKMFRKSSDLEGVYRFLNNDKVQSDAILASHRTETIARCVSSDKTILIAHDGSEFSFPGNAERTGLGYLHGGRQGFVGHFSLALESGESRNPLGVLGLRIFNREKHEVTPTDHEQSINPDREHLCWSEQAMETDRLLQESGKKSGVHLMDREGGSFLTLARLLKNNVRFVIRLRTNQRNIQTDDGPVPMDTAYELATYRMQREVMLSARPQGTGRHPARKRRMTTLEIRTASIRLKRPGKLPKVQEPTESLDLNVVFVREIDPPEGETALLWCLATSEPLESGADAAFVVDAYRSRWLIEEYFKALKTGCSVEARQLESFKALTTMLAICIPVAWTMLALRTLAETSPHAPAEQILSKKQVETLRGLASLHLGERLPTTLTAEKALICIARLGGFIVYNKTPGWQTLARGFHELLSAERLLAHMMG